LERKSLLGLASPNKIEEESLTPTTREGERPNEIESYLIALNASPFSTFNFHFSTFLQMHYITGLIIPI
jgi:hypothetical protein